MRLKRSFYLVPGENLTRVVVSSATKAYTVTTGKLHLRVLHHNRF